MQNSLFPNSLNSIIGCLSRSCLYINSPRNRTPPPSSRSVCMAKIPASFMLVTPSINPQNPKPYSTVEKRSILPFSPSEKSQRFTAPSANAAIATPIIRMKMLRQPHKSTNTPDTTGPNAGAKPITNMTIPIACPCFSFGNR